MKSPNIQLRAPEPSDLEKLYLWENDMSLWHHGNTLAPYSHHDLEQFILTSQFDIFQNRQLRLMICTPNSNEAIGTIDLFEFDPIHRRAGVGIFIEPSFQRKGHASNALEVLIEYAFSQLHLHQLFCSIQTQHTTSLKLFKKKGFDITATLKSWIQNQNRWEDVYFLQLIQNK